MRYTVEHINRRWRVIEDGERCVESYGEYSAARQAAELRNGEKTIDLSHSTGRAFAPLPPSWNQCRNCGNRRWQHPMASPAGKHEFEDDWIGIVDPREDD